METPTDPKQKTDEKGAKATEVTPEQQCLNEIDEVLKKHGMTLKTTVGNNFTTGINHYQHLLMEREFNQNTEIIFPVQIRVIKDEKQTG